jgi:hypothetical protein
MADVAALHQEHITSFQGGFAALSIELVGDESLAVEA